MRGRLSSSLFLMALGMLVFRPAAAQQTSPAADHLIVPGQRIGPFKLSASMEDLSAALALVDMGQPSKTGVIGVVWMSRGSSRPTEMFVTVHSAECRDPSTQSKCRILQIGIYKDDNHAYATADGIRIGALESQVRRVLGEPNRETKMDSHTRLLLYSSGILFTVSDSDGEHKVTGIDVRAPNCIEDDPCE